MIGSLRHECSPVAKQAALAAPKPEELVLGGSSIAQLTLMRARPHLARTELG